MRIMGPSAIALGPTDSDTLPDSQHGIPEQFPLQLQLQPSGGHVASQYQSPPVCWWQYLASAIAGRGKIATLTIARVAIAASFNMDLLLSDIIASFERVEPPVALGTRAHKRHLRMSPENCIALDRNLLEVLPTACVLQ